MTKTYGVAALSIAAAFLFAADKAEACACCTEPGQRLELTSTMDAYVRGELALVRMKPAATLFSDPGFPDSVEGLANPSMNPYRVRATIGSVVTFEIVDPAGRQGRIQFRMPSAISRFEIDPSAGKLPAPPNGPSLYKEWRLSSEARLDGIVATGGRVAVATLILHGGGNSCTSAIDFQRWTLTVKGKGISFTFLGDLKR